MTVDPNFKVNPLVEALVPDGGDPPELTCLVGYLGRSTRRNHLRLYLRNPTLQGWADIPFSRVRHMMYSKPWRAERFGVNRVWVLGKSLVVYARKEAR